MIRECGAEEYSKRPLTLPALVLSPEVDYSFAHVGQICSGGVVGGFACSAEFSLHEGNLDLAAGITDQVRFDLSTSFTQ